MVPNCFTSICVNQLTRWELLFLRLFALMQQPLWSMENGTKFHGSNVIVLLNFKLHNWQTVHTTILDLMHFKLRKLENFQFSICLCSPAECAERLNRAPRWRQPAGRPLGSTLPTPKLMCFAHTSTIPNRGSAHPAGPTPHHFYMEKPLLLYFTFFSIWAYVFRGPSVLEIFGKT